MPTQELQITTKDGLKLSAVLETPDSDSRPALVVMAHGYNTGKDSQTNTAIAQKLAREGIATLRFDFRGHGQSEGRIEDVNISTGLTDLLAAVERISQLDIMDMSRVGILGSSYGGAVATLYAARHQNIRCLALKAPACSLGEVRRLRIGAEGMKEWRQTGSYVLRKKPVDLTVPYSFYEDVTSYDLYEEAKTIHCPVLIVHGDADTTVPLAQSKKLLQSLGRTARLDIVQGADHRFTSEVSFDHMVQEVTEFFVGNLKQPAP